MNDILNNAPGTPPIEANTAELRARLVQRVQRSVAHESQFATVRRDAGTWHTPRPGVRSKALAQTPVALSALVELAAGATFVASPVATQQEVILLGGQLFVGMLALDCGDAACTPYDAAHGLRAGATGARFYLRLSAPPQPATTAVHFSSLVDDSTWQDFSPGVRVKELWSGGERRSVLVRMRAGASVNSHSHGLEEECMMLAGEAFIGDTLLRGGEYQLAPRGSHHGAVQSDVGALFFVHGSLDPAAYA